MLYCMACVRSNTGTSIPKRRRTACCMYLDTQGKSAHILLSSFNWQNFLVYAQKLISQKSPHTINVFVCFILCYLFLCLGQAFIWCCNCLSVFLLLFVLLLIGYFALNCSCSIRFLPWFFIASYCLNWLKHCVHVLNGAIKKLISSSTNIYHCIFFFLGLERPYSHSGHFPLTWEAQILNE